MKITRPTVTVVRILSVQERISQVHESVFHLARREYGLGGNDFASRIDAILSKKKSSNHCRIERYESSDTRPCAMNEVNEGYIRVPLRENLKRGYDNLGAFLCF